MAREKFATALPLLVYLSSASAPVLPMRMTLLTPPVGKNSMISEGHALYQLEFCDVLWS